MVNKMNLWDPRKNDDYRFIDNAIREYFEISGVEVSVYKYLGVFDQGDTNDATQPGQAKSKKKKELQVQDLFFKENRDRHYSDQTYQMKIMLTMQDNDFNSWQFGLFLEADVIYVEVHLNESLEILGRKLMSGDVIEMMHMRDDALLDDENPAINKFYSVEDVNRSASGWSATWRPHILRLKLKPLTNSQEFSDILGRDLEGAGFDARDYMSDAIFLNDTQNAIVAQAEYEVPYRNFETAHLYVIPGDEMGSQYPWIFAGDGKPPNGAKLAGQGKVFPSDPKENDWFLNTGYNPSQLHQYTKTGWKFREVDLRHKWQAAHRILESFINNNNVTTIAGESMPEKQALSRVIRPRGDM